MGCDGCAPCWRLCHLCALDGTPAGCLPPSRVCSRPLLSLVLCTLSLDSTRCRQCPAQIARDFGLAGEGGGTPGAGSGKGRGKKGDAASGGAALPQLLSREAAVAAARKRCEAFTLPHKLSCGVTVTNLGTLHPQAPRELAGVGCCRVAGLRGRGDCADGARALLPAEPAAGAVQARHGELSTVQGLPMSRAWPSA